MHSVHLLIAWADMTSHAGVYMRAWIKITKTNGGLFQPCNGLESVLYISSKRSSTPTE